MGREEEVIVGRMVGLTLLGPMTPGLDGWAVGREEEVIVGRMVGLSPGLDVWTVLESMPREAVTERPDIETRETPLVLDRLLVTDGVDVIGDEESEGCCGLSVVIVVGLVVMDVALSFG